MIYLYLCSFEVSLLVVQDSLLIELCDNNLQEKEKDNEGGGSLDNTHDDDPDKEEEVEDEEDEDWYLQYDVRLAVLDQGATVYGGPLRLIVLVYQLCCHPDQLVQ